MKAALITVNILLALLVVWAGIRRLESFSGKKAQEFTVKKRPEKSRPRKKNRSFNSRSVRRNRMRKS